jgi:tricorn protease
MSNARLLVVAILVTSLAAPGLASEIGYYSQPALHGDRLVFVSEGDLWAATLPESIGDEAIVAFRLTASDGSESHPCFSADGRWLAFAAAYDGNTDVYVMPADGGAPRRLTFHPGRDEPLDWMPDGGSILFRSSRHHHFGRDELWRISVAGGMPQRYDFGECSLISVSSTGRRFAFTRWSNERWTWKRYRGGTAPEIWVGDLAAETFAPITDDPASDLFPMWLAGRVVFLSDRTGTANLFSDTAQGGDLRQHTRFAPDGNDPTSIDGYDVRWPRGDRARGGTRVVFCQGGGLALLDVTSDEVTRLDVRIASDRIAARKRFAPLAETMSELSLAPDGKTVLIGSRGELMSVDVETKIPRQLTRTARAREWGATWLDDEQIALISDAAGEQQVAVGPADGSEPPSLATEDREAWLFPVVAARDGSWLAFADKTMRLHALDMATAVRHQVDRAEAGEITDYRISPDGKWLAYAKPMPNGTSAIMLHALRTRRTFTISDGMSSDHAPRWDPAGTYLYFLSDRHFDPVLGHFDYEHIYPGPTQIYALPLAAATPPPLPAPARAAGFDLAAWAKPAPAEPDADPEEPDEADAPEDAAPAEKPAMEVDTEDLISRHVLLPIAPGRAQHLEAVWGGITWVTQPERGLLDDDFGSTGLAAGRGTLHRYDFVKEKRTEIAGSVDAYAISADRRALAWPAGTSITVKRLDGGEDETIDLSSMQLRIDVRREWEQIFNEAWRLQRDFFWAPNMGGVDWPAMREKYAAVLPRIGSRGELNDVIGQLIGELGTSHTYIFGGQRHEHEEGESVSVGMLGADIVFDGAFRLQRIVPGQAWSATLASPLEPAHLGVQPGSVLLAINDQPLTPASNVYDLLQNEANRRVRLSIADDAAGANRRTIEITTLGSERQLRYLAWVDDTRRAVAAATDGVVGYVHIPDMGGQGLSLFSRQFLPQFRKRAFVIDVRDNGGGFVSQMIVQRLMRQVLGFAQPRHGLAFRYPYRAPHAHMAVLINQHAGSDGDIFPAAFRSAGLGPLIGTRTWGGVIGIRGDKAFVDLGLSTQPEFAWWDEAGWTIENEGVWPDIEVDLTPSDRLAGRDPQLDRAIAELQRALESDPKMLPDAPEYPSRR